MCPSAQSLAVPMPVTSICDWPARCSSSQIVNIQRVCVLLCWTFSLEHSSWHCKK